MRFKETPLAGAFVVEVEPHRDERGFFTRTWCSREFADHGLPSTIVQASLSSNTARGTLRGMHLQLPPSQEGKLVRCVRGRIYDVIVDLRPESSTYLGHFGIELTSRGHKALYIPPAMLHGFQTLEDETEVFYQMTDYYSPDLSFGARWDDPAFAISWPITTGLTLAERDSRYPDFDTDDYESQLAMATEADP